MKTKLDKLQERVKDLEVELEKAKGEVVWEERSIKMRDDIIACDSGKSHDWQITQWEQNIPVRPLYSVYGHGPIVNVEGASTIKIQARCFCGASVTLVK